MYVKSIDESDLESIVRERERKYAMGDDSMRVE